MAKSMFLGQIKKILNNNDYFYKMRPRQLVFLFFFWYYRSPQMAGWQSGYAADCKSVDAGSIPTSASKFLIKIFNKLKKKSVDEY